MAAHLTIEVHPANVRRGLWCSVCCLPARITLDMVTLNAHGVSTICKVDRCLECRPID